MARGWEGLEGQERNWRPTCDTSSPCVALVWLSWRCSWLEWGSWQGRLRRWRGRPAWSQRHPFEGAGGEVADEEPVLSDLADLDEAARQYEQAVRLNPAYAEAYFNLGMTREEQGRTGDAVRQLQRALELQPDLAPARELLRSLQAPVGGQP